MKIRLIKGVTLVDEQTYQPTITYLAGTILEVVKETDTAFFTANGSGIWKTEAVKL